ncbi:MAG TPA: hypothetical protein VGR08_14115, partial [Thermomicrobiales bacterium]|nr:hypothetical protein [Thermomicrobiales bacterium]
MIQRTGNPAEEMLSDAAAHLPGGGRWLVIGGEASLALAVLDDHPGADVLRIATDIRHVDDLPADHPPGLRLDANAAHPHVAPGSRDVAVLPAPSDRALARRWLVLALAALSDG